MRDLGSVLKPTLVLSLILVDHSTSASIECGRRLPHVAKRTTTPYPGFEGIFSFRITEMLI